MGSTFKAVRALAVRLKTKAFRPCQRTHEEEHQPCVAQPLQQGSPLATINQHSLSLHLRLCRSQSNYPKRWCVRLPSSINRPNCPQNIEILNGEAMPQSPTSKAERAIPSSNCCAVTNSSSNDWSSTQAHSTASRFAPAPFTGISSA